MFAGIKHSVPYIAFREWHKHLSRQLKLPQYRYGGVGFRGNRDWNGKDRTFFLTSEGETDRDKGNGTRGRWCLISGKVGDQSVGIAILCHPDNFRGPQPMRNPTWASLSS